MRTLFYFSLSTFIALSSPNCRKNNSTPAAELPPITQEGKNTFGCKVNGKVWVPYYKCGGSGNPCGEVRSSVNKLIGSNLRAVSLFFGYRPEPNNIESFLIETQINQGIISTGNKADSLAFEFSEPGGIIYYNYNYFKTDRIELTKFDTVNKIIAGVFELTLYDGLDSVRITEGRFDLKFTFCKCSN